MRRKALLVAHLLAWLVACNRPDATPEGTGAVEARPADPRAAALYDKLFAAADAGDIEAFRRVLTRSSIALCDTHLEKVAKLPRPEGVSALGWADLLRFHADLPAAARERTPYPVVMDDGAPRLDLAAHRDARFFEAVAAGIDRVAP